MRGATEMIEPGTEQLKISTHTPLAGRDIQGLSTVLAEEPFLLTRPLRGATLEFIDEKITDFISTHTPLAGRDR